MILGEVNLVPHRADELDGRDTCQPGHLAFGIVGGFIQIVEVVSQKASQRLRGSDGNASSFLVGYYGGLVCQLLHSRASCLSVCPHWFPLLQVCGDTLLCIVCNH